MSEEITHEELAEEIGCRVSTVRSFFGDGEGKE